MRRALILCALLMLFARPAWADSTIPNLSAAGPAADGDLFMTSQGGAAGTKQSNSVLFTYIQGKLGTAANANTGSSGHNVPFLDGVNTWSAINTFSNALTFSGLIVASQVSCLGLDASNHVVLANAACGAGGAGTPGGAANSVQFNSAGSFGGFTLGGDCTLVVATGVITCTKSNGTLFAAVATSGSASDLSSGTLPAARLPNPSASTLGGVESFAPVSHQWINQISTIGGPSATQPAFTDISGQATFAQLPTIANSSLYGNVSGVPAVPATLAIGQGLIGNANGLQTFVPSRTVSASTTVLGCSGSPCVGGDMGGIIYLTGTGTLTIPAISGTILTTGMSFQYQNNGSGTWTISSSPAINGLPSTSVPPGAFGTITGNGATLDWTGFSPPTATEMGGVQAKTCAGGLFVSAINTDSTVTCNTPAGGGNLSSTGSPVAHGVGLFESATTLTSTAVMTNGQLLVGATGADPAPQTMSQDCTINSSLVITCTKTNNVAFTSAATTAIGTSGATIPLLSTANTWTLGQTYSALINATAGIGNGASTGLTFDSGTGTNLIQGAQADQAQSQSVPTTGFTLNLGSTHSTYLLKPAGTLATGTINMPSTASIFDGFIVRVSSTQTITALTLSPGASQTIINAPTTIVAGGGFQYEFRAADTTWYPLNTAPAGAQLNVGQTWTATQTFSTIGGYLANVGPTTSTACTLTSSGNAGCSSLTNGQGDCGTFIKHTTNTQMVVTIPATLAIGCQVAFEDAGTFGAKGVILNGSAVAAATLHSGHSFTGTAAQYSVIGITIDANAGGSAAIAVLTGDGA